MKVVIDTICPFCGQITSVAVEEKALIAYENGALVQDAFPNLSAGEREALISGLCDKCQAIFDNEEKRWDDLWVYDDYEEDWD